MGIEATFLTKIPLHTLRVNLFQRPTLAKNESRLNIIDDIWEKAKCAQVQNMTMAALVCHIFSNILGGGELDGKIKDDVNTFLHKEPNPLTLMS